MEELINKVVLWSKDRNLNTADPNKQLLKLWEEFGELMFEFDIENYEFLRKLETEALIDSTAYEILHLRNFIQSIKDIVTRLCIIAERYDAELDWCLESAYNEIKDRRGKMVNGVFVKESDLNG